MNEEDGGCVLGVLWGVYVEFVVGVWVVVLVEYDF